MREKLILWLLHVGCPDDGCDFCQYGESEHCRAEITADHLIANGVTIQKWIPVTERLPEKGKLVLAIARCGDPAVVYKCNNFWRVLWDNCKLDNGEVTHWMPLPEPPNGERRTDETLQ